MSVDPVPWFIQAPAEHSAEVARTLAYQAIGGKEGLARVGDLTVQALAVPGGAVQVLPGAAGILNRGSGGAGQAYVGRVGSAVTVPVAPTGSGAGRSDLVVFRVKDPQYGGGAPASAVAGPYIFVEIVSGVPAETKRLQAVPGREADSAVTLARIDLPPSTGTVTNAMITNLAAVANPRRQRAMITKFPTGVRTIGSGSYGPWPLTADERPVVDVPEWATVVRISCIIMGAKFTAGSVETVAGIRTGFGTTTPGQNTILIEDAGSSAGRHLYAVVGTHQIPASLRGTQQLINVQAQMTSPAGSGQWTADYQTSVLIDYEFSEV